MAGRRAPQESGAVPYVGGRDDVVLLLATPQTSLWITYLVVLLFAVAETGGSNNWATFGDYFGRRAYGRLRGITQLASSPGVFLAPVFAGWWYDRTESYTLPLWVFTVFFGLGALFFALMRKPKGSRYRRERKSGRCLDPNCQPIARTLLNFKFPEVDGGHQQAAVDQEAAGML